MHRDLMREIMNQRVAERQEEARQNGLVRALRKTSRQRNHAETPDLLLPPIPDYADGSFRSGELPAGPVGATRR